MHIVTSNPDIAFDVARIQNPKETNNIYIYIWSLIIIHTKLIMICETRYEVLDIRYDAFDIMY